MFVFQLGCLSIQLVILGFTIHYARQAQRAAREARTAADRADAARTRTGSIKMGDLYRQLQVDEIGTAVGAQIRSELVRLDRETR